MSAHDLCFKPVLGMLRKQPPRGADRKILLAPSEYRSRRHGEDSRVTGDGSDAHPVLAVESIIEGRKQRRIRDPIGSAFEGDYIVVTLEMHRDRRLLGQVSALAGTPVRAEVERPLYPDTQPA